jgi:GntR family transcriptional regulator
MIVRDIARKIESGELRPGDEVPSVTKLAETYGVSHTTARRALADLKARGLTEAVPGWKTFVRQVPQNGP